MTDTRDVWLLVKVPDVSVDISDAEVLRIADDRCSRTGVRLHTTWATVSVAEQVGWSDPTQDALGSVRMEYDRPTNPHDVPAFRKVVARG